MRIAAAVALALVTAAPVLAAKLPPQALRGPETRLRQYPTLSAATPTERAAARQLRGRMQSAALGWRTLHAALRAGFDTRRVLRNGELAGLYLHAEHRENSNDRVYLDPDRPEALIYANVPGRPLVLIGLMFSVPRSVRGATPGGPITRWHTHRVCAHGHHRGLRPRRDGSCPPGSRPRQGSEMLHFWLTRDLRSAFAIHAPAPELCRDGLLTVGCRHARPRRRAGS